MKIQKIVQYFTKNLSNQPYLLIFIIIFGLGVWFQGNTLIINEFLTSNSCINTDTIFVDYMDWIELYNQSPFDIDISGYYLTDNLGNPDKWKFPQGTIIRAKGYYLIWADGRDTLNHCSFKLSVEGESIGLFDYNKNVVDSITYPVQSSDVSMGLSGMVPQRWVYFGEPSPGGPNQGNYAVSRHDIASSPRFSKEGGFFKNQFTLTISSQNREEEIRYTLDGSIPSSSSKILTSPLTISSNRVVRARIFKPGFLPSKIITHTYFINQNTDLPVLAITIDSLHMWDDKIGFYTLGNNGVCKWGVTANYFQNWSKPINLEYFENTHSPSVSNITCGIKNIGLRRNMYQKSLKVFTRDKYGAGEIENQVFANKNIKNFKNLFLRNSGFDDFKKSALRDGLVVSLVAGKMDIDYMAYKPAAVYINGEYWGLYKIREKIDEYYLAANHNVDPKKIDMIEFNNVVIHGNATHYCLFLNYLESCDLNSAQGYAYMNNMIDINELINYLIVEVFTCNTDWPMNNNKRWRPQTSNGKWRWILHDIDAGFGNWRKYDFNSLSATLAENSSLWWNPPWSTFVFRKVLENDAIRWEFIQRFAAYMNSLFLPERIHHFIDSLKTDIEAEMYRHIEKWGVNCVPNDSECKDGCVVESFAEWMKHIEVLHEFAQKRSDYVYKHIIEKFNLAGTAELKVTFANNKMGRFYVNDVLISDSTFSGRFFKNVPLKIKVIPNIGFYFNRNNPIFKGKNEVEINLNGDKNINLEFTKKENMNVPELITDEYTLVKHHLPYLVSGDIAVDSQAVLTIEPGVQILMNTNSNIIVHGALIARGNKDDNIEIKPDYESGVRAWGALFFNHGSPGSQLKNISVIDGSTYLKKPEYVGTICSYNTNLTIDSAYISSKTQPLYSSLGHLQITNSTLTCENTCDFINVKNGTAVIEKCIFSGNQALNTDAIDYDKVTDGIIKDCRIYNFLGDNSDGIDLGEGSVNILIVNNFIRQCNDKGISVGQSSTALVKNNIITGCSMGIGIKDTLSYAKSVNNTFYDNQVAVACFEKNIGKGYGNGEIVNTIMSQCKQAVYICGDRASLTISYSLSDQKKILGKGNLYANPQFVDPMELNFSLQDNSPCIDRGDPLSPKDDDGSRADIGATCSEFQNPKIKTRLLSIHPNPVKQFAHIFINFQTKYNGRLQVLLLNVKGQVVAELLNKNINTKVYGLQFDASNYVSGLYFCRMEAEGRRKMQKFILVK